MANLNLSEFTEKLFVADADHTFIWDSAASISKRVSRNSWLNSGTLTSDAPVTISQTWGTTGTYTAAKINVTETATANPASRLLDLQLGGASKAYVDKNGAIYGTGVVSGVTFKTWVNAAQVYNVDLVGVGLIFAGYPGQFFLPASSFMGWNSNDVGSGSVDTKLFRDSASGNTLALRNGAAAQTFNIYASYSDASNYSRLSLGPLTGGDDYYIITGNSGTGIARGLNLRVGTGRSVYMGVGSTDIFRFSTAGLTFLADNSYDIGANGANRPKNVYVAQTVRANAFQLNGLSHVYSTVNGNIGLYDNNLTAFNLLQFGGTTNLFPAIKRSTTTIQARLADDSAFTNIQGKLTTDTAFTSGAITDTGYIVLYDSTGTAYKVACTPV